MLIWASFLKLESISIVIKYRILLPVIVFWFHDLMISIIVAQIEPYQAVERPATFAPVKHFAPQLAHEDSSESSSESSSDSSSEEDFRPAKKRQKFNAKAPLGIAPATVKRNVWSSVIFEDHIEKELKDVNVHTGKTLLDKSRDVESYYNYGRKLAGRLGGEEIAEEAQIQEKLIQLDKKDGGDSFQPAEEEPNSSTTADDFERSLQETQQLLKSRKRKMDDRQVDEPKKNKAPGISKSLRQRMQRVEDLSVTATSSPLDVAKDIGLKLHEEKSELITRAVNIIGVEAAIKLFKDTQEAENDGGIYVAVCIVSLLTYLWLVKLYV